MFNKNILEFSSGYFGKLPEFNDFIKFNAGSPEFSFIDNWLQAGLEYAKLNYKNEWKEKYNCLQPTRFFLPVPSSGKVIVGMLYPGKDKIGREFPFLIFTLLPGNYFDDFTFIPSILQPVLSAFDEMLRKENDTTSLTNTLKNYTITLPQKKSLQNRFNDYLSDTSVNEFLKRTNLSYSNLNMTDLMYSESIFINFSFYSNNEFFGYDAGVLLSLLNKKIKLSYLRSSIFWNQNNDGKYQFTIFPFNITAINFVDLLSIYDDSRLLNLFSKPHSLETSQLENKYLLKQFLTIS